LLEAPEKLAAGVAALIEDLDQTDPRKHHRAMQVLVALGDKTLADAERLLAQEPWPDEQLAAVAKLAEQLGDLRFQVRQHATERLLAMGRIAADTVEQVADMTDAEVRLRVERIKQQAKHHLPSSPTLRRQLAMIRVLESISTRGAASLLQATAEDGSSPTLEQHAAAALAALERRRRESEQIDDQ
jgi:DNA-binding transcriptional ArsR family regulator